MTHSMLSALSSSRHLLAGIPPNNPTYALRFHGGGTAMEVLAIALIVVGILVCLFSIAFRRSHCSLALLAFSWGAFYYAIYHSMNNLSTETCLWASVLCALGVAAVPLIPGPYVEEYSPLKGRFYIRSSMSRPVVTLTAFLIGVAAGLVIWWAIFISYPTIYNGTQKDYAWGIFAACGGGMGILCGALGNVGIALGTPIVGSFLAIQGFEYFTFADGNILAFLALDRNYGTCVGNKCLYDMACFAGGVGLGWIIQFALLARLREELVLVPAAASTSTYQSSTYTEPASFGYANTSTTYTGEPSYNSYNAYDNRYNNAYTPSKTAAVYTPTNYGNMNANNDYPTLRLGNNKAQYYA